MFIDHRIIIVSILYILILASYGISELFDFGKILTLKNDNRRNKGATDEMLTKEFGFNVVPVYNAD